MNSKSHLNRVSIVDAIGRQTTVHRRQNAASTAVNAVPAPSAQLHERKNDRARLVGILRNHKADQGWDENDQNLYDMLGAYSPQLISDMIPTAKRLAAIDAGSSERHAVRGLFSAIRSADPEDVEAVVNYGHFISGHLRMFDVIDLVKQINSLDRESRTGTFTANTEAHIQAAGEYLGDANGNKYWNNLPLMQLVNKYPDHPSELVEFWTRGNGVTDPAVIEDYLSKGHLKDGWL